MLDPAYSEESLKAIVDTFSEEDIVRSFQIAKATNELSNYQARILRKTARLYHTLGAIFLAGTILHFVDRLPLLILPLLVYLPYAFFEHRTINKLLNEATEMMQAYGFGKADIY